MGKLEYNIKIDIDNGYNGGIRYKQLIVQLKRDLNGFDMCRGL